MIHTPLFTGCDVVVGTALQCWPVATQEALTRHCCRCRLSNGEDVEWAKYTIKQCVCWCVGRRSSALLPTGHISGLFKWLSLR